MTVSRELKLSIERSFQGLSSPLIKFIKGLVHNLQKTGRCTLFRWYCFIQTILKAEVNVGLSNIEICNSPTELVEFFYAYTFWFGQALILMLSIWNFTDIRPYKRPKFWIHSLQIKVRTSFFVWQKFFSCIFVEIRNIEIRNRLLWVSWYYRNSTFSPYQAPLSKLILQK